MTPKEKALSLLDKMERQTYSYQEYAGANPSIAEIGYEAGKKCALISVNEIIQSIAKIEGIEKLGVVQLNQLEYWSNVKQELKKL